MGSFPAATWYQLQNYRWRWAPDLAGRKWVANSSLDKHRAIMGPDSALFFSFYPSVFDSSITHLQDSLQKISSCMTAKLLTLNSSKTEFLLVGLPQQLAKINTSSLISLSSQSWFYCWRTPHFLSLTKYLLSLNLATIIFVNFVVFVLISWLQNCQYHRHFHRSF